VLAGIFSVTAFLLIRHIVLRRKNSFNLSLYTLPIWGFICFWVACYAVLKKGEQLVSVLTHFVFLLISSCQNLVSSTELMRRPVPTNIWVTGLPKVSKDITGDDGKVAWISACAGAVGFILAGAAGIPWIKYKVNKEKTDKAQKAADTESGKAADDAIAAENEANKKTPTLLDSVRRSKMFKFVDDGLNYDIHGIVETDSAIASLHENSEVFDDDTELAYKYMQIFSACANMFAHGSNDVANAVGPFAAIYSIWRTSAVGSKAATPEWILVMGGLGMSLGLATYGYKIMRVMGVKMTRLSNSRGFAIELSASIVVIMASRYGLPTSTTQTVTGAITGVGMLEGRKGFNWLLLGKFFLGWVATLIVAGLTSAAFTAQGVYAPSKNMVDDRAELSTSMNVTTVAYANEFESLGYTQAAANFAADAAALEQPVLDVTVPLDTIYQQMAFMLENLPPNGPM
jgi:solute carrier family 20 (sodium-dependent phosphate transporter)